MLPLRGILPACITPFDADENVDLEALAHNVRRWNATRLSGCLILGSTGEFVHVDENERDRIIATAREQTPPDRLLVLGTGAQTTAKAISYTRRAAQLGADAALVVTPFFYKPQMQGETLVRHFCAVADASQIPVMIYNVPMFTGVNVAVETISRIAEHPNIVGIKDSTGDVMQLNAVITDTPRDFAVFTGGSRVLHAALTVGCAGAMAAVVNVAFDLATAIATAVAEGRNNDARQLQARMTALEMEIRPSGLGGWKAALDMMGYRGGFPRRPALPADDTARARIRNALVAAGIVGPADLEESLR
jgi:4-hydroxy-2-oxoglutarate aldolase